MNLKDILKLSFSVQILTLFIEFSVPLFFFCILILMYAIYK